jgi:hypothetical protein
LTKLMPTKRVPFICSVDTDLPGIYYRYVGMNKCPLT